MKITKNATGLRIILLAVLMLAGQIAQAETTMSISETVTAPIDSQADDKPSISTEDPTGSGSKQSVEDIWKAQGLSDCFEYYKFQSVQLSFGTEKDVFVPGEEIRLTGAIANQNAYPLVDGSVFARVLRKDAGGNPFVDGYPVVAEFFPIQNVSLDSNEVKEVNFSWTVPTAAMAGDYEINYFYSVSKKFNLAGLSFSNEIINGLTRFSVQSDEKGSVYFDRTRTQVNGQTYKHIGNWPIIEKDGPAMISQPLVNGTSTKKDVVITYDLYYWDSLSEGNLISTKQEEFELAPGENKTPTFEISKLIEPAYYLRITARDGENKSIVNVRVVSNQERVRLNFAGLSSFPIKKDQPITYLACFHGASNATAEGRVKVELFDKENRKIDEFEYQGDISPQIVAKKKELLADKDYSYVKLVATAYDMSGEVKDNVSLVFDCNILGNCPATSPVDVRTPRGAMNVILLIVGIPLIVWLISRLARKKGGNKSFPTALLFLAFFMAGLGSSGTADAYNQKSVTKSSDYGLAWAGACNATNGRFAGNGNLSVTHYVDMTVGGTAVAPGAAINFAYNPSQVAYTASGGYWDTPNARWCNNTAGGGCGADWAEGQTVYYSSSPGTHLWIAVKPGVSMTSSNTAVVSCSGMNCTAVGPGTATLTANIGATPCRLWARIWRRIAINPDVYGWDELTGNEMYLEPAGISHCGPNNGYAGYNTVNLSSTSVSWTITVASPYTCTGANPTNAAACSGDDTGLSANTPKTAVSVCSTPAGSAPKCEFTCNAGYILKSGACVLPTCTGSDPANATLCSGDNAGLTADTAKTSVSACSAPAGSAPKCQYACNAGFVLQGGACVPLTYSCLDPQPGNAALCSGDDVGLTANVQKAAVSVCSSPAGSAPKCEYQCNSGYILSGSNCVPQPCAGSPCTSLDINSVACPGDGTTINSRSWWIPANCAALGECRCVCESGFAWDGAKCACSNPMPYRWQASPAPSCGPGDNCNKKYGLQECYNNCNQRVADENCPQPKPDAPSKTCPCTNRDNTYREVNP